MSTLKTFLVILGVLFAVFAFPLLLIAQAAPAAPAVATSVPLAAKILGVAAVVYTVLQAVKKFIPALSGPWAIVLNLVFSILGFVVTVPADQLFSLSTVLAVLSAAGTAAGAHGTIKSLTS
jgi:sugar phosphate permease